MQKERKMPKVKKIKEEGAESAVNPAEEKRNALIEGLRGKLLTKAQLKKGGFGVRSRNQQESNYEAVIEEINSYGRQLGLSDMSLGSLRQ